MTAGLLHGVLVGAILSGTSLCYAGLGELVGEKGGIVNLGLEGVMLIGAAVAFAVTSLTGNPYCGVLAAAAAGGAINLLFGYLVIGRRADQLASGLTVMFLGIGLSALIGQPFVGGVINGLPKVHVGGLVDFDFLVCLAVPVTASVWWLLYKTSWGLGLRAVGENPEA